MTLTDRQLQLADAAIMQYAMINAGALSERQLQQLDELRRDPERDSDALSVVVFHMQQTQQTLQAEIASAIAAIDNLPPPATDKPTN
jgi:hypothetical protein